MMRKLTIEILLPEKGKRPRPEELKARVIEPMPDGGTASYLLHNFNFEFIAALGPMEYADAARDVRNQYHIRRHWMMLPNCSTVPTVPTPTMSWDAKTGLYVEDPLYLCAFDEIQVADLDRLPEEDNEKK